MEILIRSGEQTVARGDITRIAVADGEADYEVHLVEPAIAAGTGNKTRDFTAYGIDRRAGTWVTLIQILAAALRPEMSAAELRKLVATKPPPKMCKAGTHVARKGGRCSQCADERRLRKAAERAEAEVVRLEADLRKRQRDLETLKRSVATIPARPASSIAAAPPPHVQAARAANLAKGRAALAAKRQAKAR